MTEKREVSVKLLEISCIKNSVWERLLWGGKRNAREKRWISDRRSNPVEPFREQIQNLQMGFWLHNGSASQVQLFSSTKNPASIHSQYVCVSISNNTFALMYSKLYFFLKKLFFSSTVIWSYWWCLGTRNAWRILIPSVLFSTLSACLILCKILMNSFKQYLDFTGEDITYAATSAGTCWWAWQCCSHWGYKCCFIIIAARHTTNCNKIP